MHRETRGFCLERAAGMWFQQTQSTFQPTLRQRLQDPDASSQPLVPDWHSAAMLPRHAVRHVAQE